MPITLTVDDRDVRQALDRLERRLATLTPVMHDIGEALVAHMRDRIRDGVDADGRPFAPNSPVTLARKRGTKPLVNRGNFAGERLFYQARRDAVEVGASAIQAAVLQFGARKGAFGRTRRGAPIPWGDIPARPYLPLTRSGELPPTDREAVLAMLAEALERSV